MGQKIMRQSSFFRLLANEHRDRPPDCLMDVNKKVFVAIPDKNRATAAGGEHSTNMYLNDRFVHRVDGTDGRTKNKLLPAARMSLAPRAGMVVSGERRLPACNRRQLADDVRVWQGCQTPQA